MGGSSPCASMPDQPPLPGDTKQAIIISLIVMSGVLISGFAACRRHDISGRHVGGHMTTLPFTGGHAQVPTIWLYAGLAFMILAMGALMPVIRLRMGAGSKGRHAGTPTIGRRSR